MHRRTSIALILASSIGLSSIGLAGASEPAEPSVAHPSGYRSWKHVKSMVIEEGHPLFASFGGIHHLYANAKALEGYRTGVFPDGAVIAFDLLEATRAEGAVVEGRRKVLGVMERDVARFAATGGWGFEGFAEGDPNRRVVGNDAATACYACHTSRAEASYVFSSARD